MSNAASPAGVPRRKTVRGGRDRPLDRTGTSSFGDSASQAKKLARTRAGPMNVATVSTTSWTRGTDADRWSAGTGPAVAITSASSRTAGASASASVNVRSWTAASFVTSRRALRIWGVAIVQPVHASTPSHQSQDPSGRVARHESTGAVTPVDGDPYEPPPLDPRTHLRKLRRGSDRSELLARWLTAVHPATSWVSSAVGRAVPRLRPVGDLRHGPTAAEGVPRTASTSTTVRGVTASRRSSRNPLDGWVTGASGWAAVWLTVGPRRWSVRSAPWSSRCPGR